MLGERYLFYLLSHGFQLGFGLLRHEHVVGDSDGDERRRNRREDD